MKIRHIAQKINLALKDTPVILLNGARQTGKSTLVNWIAKQHQIKRQLANPRKTI